MNADAGPTVADGALPGAYRLGNEAAALFGRSQPNWLAVAPPFSAKFTAEFWFELAGEFDILCTRNAVQPRATAATFCPDFRDFDRHGKFLVEHGGFICMPERPYLRNLPGTASLAELAQEDHNLRRLLYQGRVITWTEDDLRPPGASRLANPFGLSGMLAFLARLGAKGVHVLFSEELADRPSMSLLERRFLGVLDTVRALGIEVTPLLA